MLLTASCTEVRVETRVVVPDVPAGLLEPCLAPDRPYETLADVALILADQVQALDCANGHIAGISTILADAAAGLIDHMPKAAR